MVDAAKPYKATDADTVLHNPCAILYINLDRATERRRNMEQEILRVFPDPQRNIVTRMIGSPHPHIDGR